MTSEERFERLEISLHNIRDILAETAAMNLRTEAALRRAADQRHDELIDKLAAAQLVTEEKLQRFIQSSTHHNGDS